MTDTGSITGFTGDGKMSVDATQKQHKLESKTSVGNFVLLTTDDEMTSTINKWGGKG